VEAWPDGRDAGTESTNLMEPAALRYVAEDAPTGYGDAADRLVRAVRGAGTHVEYRGWSNTGAGAAAMLVPFSRDPLPHEVASPGAPTVAHLVPEYYPLVRSVVHDGPFVAHTVWESDRLPAHWPELLDATDLVIVPTQWNRDVFTSSGVRAPVTVVPHVATTPEPGDGGAALGLGPDDFVFYTIGRWDERKAVFLALEAYLRAFTADDPVVLVVKTGPRLEMPPGEWGAANPWSWTTGWQVASLVKQFRNPARVHLEVDIWPDDRVAGLHARGDCYLTLARGEGWGIGAFDASAYGNPVVATGWGGFLEYLDGESAFLVDYRLAAVEHHAFASYSADQQWAAPDLDFAVDVLRAVVADPDAARVRAAIARDRVLDRYAPDRVARQFLDVLR
jgi:glycosyltransferase involved in cell wall biosynthesis